MCDSAFPSFSNAPISTIYYGGGTPSLFSPSEFAFILAALKKNFTISENAEISFEVNPGTLLEKDLSGYLAAGLDRITIGIQSFNDKELKILSRIHSGIEAVSIITAARHAGYNNIGIDLIFGIPGQSLKSWIETLNRAIDTGPEHISMYGLTIEKNTPLYKAVLNKELTKCNEELEREMYLTGIETLVKAGYEHYEISNLAKPGFRSQHNQKYWEGSTYLGLGPSAHSFDGNKRWWNTSDMKKYLAEIDHSRLPVEKSESLDQIQKIQELILLGLRRVEGISFTKWQELTGKNLITQAKNIIAMLGVEENVPPFTSSPTEKLLAITSSSLGLTREGVLLYDSICEKFAEII